MNILQAMKDALDAFDSSCRTSEIDTRENLRAAIEEMERAEPVGWAIERENGNGFKYVGLNRDLCLDRKWVPLYAHPAPATNQEPMAHTQKSEFERGYDTGFLVGAEKGRTLPIPEGWQLVPIEPTEEMVNAGDDVAVFNESYESDTYLENTEQVYKAMLAATSEYKP